MHIFSLLQKTGLYHGWFWGYSQLRARDFKCLSYQGMSSLITDLVVGLQEKATFIERAETMLHDHFGDIDYWSCRRSMRFVEICTFIIEKRFYSYSIKLVEL